MRFALNSDDDGHWFVMPADKVEEFNRLIEEIDDDFELPKWAHEVGGHPNNVTFEAPEIFGEAV